MKYEMFNPVKMSSLLLILNISGGFCSRALKKIKEILIKTSIEKIKKKILKTSK